MTNIIEFPKITKSGDDAGEWLFNLAVYSHGEETSCFITEVAPSFDGMNRGAATRIMADRLDDLSFLMRQFAEKLDETEKGEALVVVTIFSGGHARIRTNCEKVVTDEQREWVREMLDVAKTDANIAGAA